MLIYIYNISLYCCIYIDYIELYFHFLLPVNQFAVSLRLWLWPVSHWSPLQIYYYYYYYYCDNINKK